MLWNSHKNHLKATLLSEVFQIPVTVNRNQRAMIDSLSLERQHEAEFLRERQRSYKVDLWILSISFLISYLSIMTTQNLLSNIGDEVLGNTAMGMTYISMSITSMYSPLVVSWLGMKHSMILNFALASIFVLCNIWPTWLTLIPTAIALGFGSSVGWTAQGSYIGHISKKYSQYGFELVCITERRRSRREQDDEELDEREQSASSSFSGWFFAVFQWTQVIGNTIAYFVFRNSSAEVDRATKQRLFAILTLLTVTGACFVWLFMRAHGSKKRLARAESAALVYEESPLQSVSGTPRAVDPSSFFTQTQPTGENSPDHTQREGASWSGEANMDEEHTEGNVEVEGGDSGNLGSAHVSLVQRWIRRSPGLNLLRTKLLLLVPLFFYVGYEQGFFFGAVTRYLMEPLVGESNVPLTMVLFGAFDIVSCYICGYVGTTRRKVVSLLAFGCWIHLAAILLICSAAAFTEYPQTDNPWSAVVLVTMLWGFGDATGNTMVVALLGHIFPNQKTRSLAFSQYYMVTALGSCSAFVISPFLNLFSLSSVQGVRVHLFFVTIVNLATLAALVLLMMNRRAIRELGSNRM